MAKNPVIVKPATKKGGRNYVYSTLSAGNTYVVYKPAVTQFPERLKEITIRGGANVSTKALVTPKGVVTEVDDEELEELHKIQAFIDHKEKGFITVETTSDYKKRDPEVVAEDMEAKDKSAPRTPSDYGSDNINESGGVATIKLPDKKQDKNK